MPRALFKDAVLADSELCHIVEGNFYFPPDAVEFPYPRASDTYEGCA